MISFTKAEAQPALDQKAATFAAALPLRAAFGRIITLSQVIADALTVFACYMGSYIYYTGIYGGWSPQTLPQFAALSCVIALLYVFIIDRVGLYRREISLLNIKELRGIFHVGLYAAAIILSATFYVRFMTLSRLTFTIALLATPIALPLQRRLFHTCRIAFAEAAILQNSRPVSPQRLVANESFDLRRGKNRRAPREAPLPEPLPWDAARGIFG